MKKIIKKKCNSRPMIKLDSNLNTMFFFYIAHLIKIKKGKKVDDVPCVCLDFLHLSSG
jgi:hypothetical protein